MKNIIFLVSINNPKLGAKEPFVPLKAFKTENEAKRFVNFRSLKPQYSQYIWVIDQVEFEEN